MLQNILIALAIVGVVVGLFVAMSRHGGSGSGTSGSSTPRRGSGGGSPDIKA